MPTTIRGLPLMSGADLASTIDNTFDAAMNALDTAAFYLRDTFANRPTAATAKRGSFFEPTDLPGYLYVSTGTDWVEVAPGMGAVPIGASLDWWGSGDPGDTRFVKLDGRALSTTTYAALYALLGNTFDTLHGQAAPGAGLFRIPKVAGHVLIGAGASPKAGISARTLGETLGEEGHILIVSEMPSHDHGGQTGGMNRNNPHAHIYDRPAPLSVATGGASGTQYAGEAYTSVNTDIAHEHSIPAQGGGGSHNNMQPSIACHRIMRIA